MIGAEALATRVAEILEARRDKALQEAQRRAVDHFCRAVDQDILGQLETAPMRRMFDTADLGGEQ